MFTLIGLYCYALFGLFSCICYASCLLCLIYVVDFWWVWVCIVSVVNVCVCFWVGVFGLCLLILWWIDCCWLAVVCSLVEYVCLCFVLLHDSWWCGFYLSFVGIVMFGFVAFGHLLLWVFVICRGLFLLHLFAVFDYVDVIDYWLIASSYLFYLSYAAVVWCWIAACCVVLLTCCLWFCGFAAVCAVFCGLTCLTARFYVWCCYLIVDLCLLLMCIYFEGLLVTLWFNGLWSWFDYFR